MTPHQVQALWLKQAELRPKPDAMDNVRLLQDHLVDILNRAKTRFPNVQISYLSSRTYGGYSGRHPEPESFATAFAHGILHNRSECRRVVSFTGLEQGKAGIAAVFFVVNVPPPSPHPSTSLRAKELHPRRRGAIRGGMR
jgi:hypothetical protein